MGQAMKTNTWQTNKKNATKSAQLLHTRSKPDQTGLDRSGRRSSCPGSPLAALAQCGKQHAATHAQTQLLPMPLPPPLLLPQTVAMYFSLQIV